MRINKLFLILAILLPAMVKAQSMLPDNFFMTKLDNGLQVLVIEDHNLPLVTVELTVHNGSFCETPEYNGLSHLFEHMFFKANRDYPSQEIYLDRVNQLGIVFNGTTGTERVNYFVTLEKSNWQDGLRFMNSAIRYPLFLEDEMKREDPVVDGEFQRDESNPFFHLEDAINHHLWGDLYCRKNPIGDHDIIMTCTPEKMRTIKDRYYFPNNTLLTFAGDINHEDAFKMAKEVMGDWQPSSFDPFTKWPIPEFKPLESTEQFVVENPNTKVPVISLNWIGPNTRYDVNSTYAADVFSYITSQQTSKLQQALVETGLAYQVNISYNTQKIAGPISVTLVPNPQKIKEAYAELFNQMSQWADDDYFTDDQLQIAKDLITVDDAYSKEKTSDYVHTVTYWWATASIDYYTTYVQHVQAVTRQEIKDYINNYILNHAFVAGLLVHPDMRTTFNTDAFFTDTKKPDGFVINFAENSADMNADEQAKMAAVIQWMKLNKNVKIKVQGIADNTEDLKLKDQKYKDLLSHYTDINLYSEGKVSKKYVRLDLARSLSVTDYLVQNGVDRTRIIGAGTIAEGKSESEVKSNYKSILTVTQ